MAKPKPKSTFLKGWQQIAAFLGLPISAAQRWAKIWDASYSRRSAPAVFQSSGPPEDYLFADGWWGCSLRLPFIP
ncbi:MAG TPA: hypothetical protein VNO32_63740 [Candidatus Acidoferrum sp.]|nr:hypothetical protein [Candidatus Acidoferrum sp.]